VVNNTGGLADTVVDATLETVQKQTATGFVMQKDDAEGLYAAITSALELHKNKVLWKRLQRTAMKQNFGWSSSAESYRRLYNDQRRSNDARSAG